MPMDKWTELQNCIRELYDNNTDNEDIKMIAEYILNLMDVLSNKEK